MSTGLVGIPGWLWWSNLKYKSIHKVRLITWVIVSLWLSSNMSIGWFLSTKHYITLKISYNPEKLCWKSFRKKEPFGRKYRKFQAGKIVFKFRHTLLGYLLFYDVSYAPEVSWFKLQILSNGKRPLRCLKTAKFLWVESDDTHFQQDILACYLCNIDSMGRVARDSGRMESANFELRRRYPGRQ